MPKDIGYEYEMNRKRCASLCFAWQAHFASLSFSLSVSLSSVFACACACLCAKSLQNKIESVVVAAEKFIIQ